MSTTRIDDHAKALSRLRGAAGMTRKDLAEATGIAISTLGHFETGRHQPSIEQIEMICKVLGASPSLYLFLTKRVRMSRKRYQEGPDFTLMARELLCMAMNVPSNTAPRRKKDEPIKDEPTGYMYQRRKARATKRPHPVRSCKDGTWAERIDCVLDLNRGRWMTTEEVVQALKDAGETFSNTTRDPRLPVVTVLTSSRKKMGWDRQAVRLRKTGRRGLRWRKPRPGNTNGAPE